MAPAAVLVCVLGLLGRPASSLPPIELLADPPPDVSANAEAFVRIDSGVISIITSTSTFREARCGNQRSLLKLASIITHEEWHVRNGADERGAYEAQLMTLMWLGAGPDSGVYRVVRRSMNTAVALQKERYAELRRAAAERLAAAKRVEEADAEAARLAAESDATVLASARPRNRPQVESPAGLR